MKFFGFALWKQTLALCLAALLAACAGAPQAMPSVTIDRESAHEECVNLRKGESIEYTFKTDQHVAFNIHYHADKSVEYPIQVEDTNGETGTIQADAKRRYCFMWDNQGAGDVGLSYKLNLKEATP